MNLGEASRNDAGGVERFTSHATGNSDDKRILDNKAKGESGMPQRNKKRKPDTRAFFTNLGVNMPWSDKLRLLFRNTWIKIKRLQSCCGNPGEPGC